MSNPTIRTVKLLRDRGYRVANVEKYNHITKRRTDLFGFIDVLAIREGETLAVQTTSYANVSSRIRKIESDELADALADVRAAGWGLHVHGWHKKNNRWVCREVDIS